MTPLFSKSFYTRFLAVVIVLAFLLIIYSEREGGFFEPKYIEAQSIGKDVSNFEGLSDKFAKLAEEKGALYAFEVLRRTELPPQTDFHLLAHIVGDELYKQKGVSGITHCTQEFRNACSHSMVIGTLNAFGEAGLDGIREACKEAPGGSGAYTMCYHGLGHGVFSHFAFQFPETIDFCKKTGTREYHDREYIECIGGSVMELMGGGGHDPYNWGIARDKYLNKKDPLSLCLGDEIPKDAKEICLIYLTPYIWESIGVELGNPDPNQFNEAFAICDEIPRTEQNLRDACFGGFGKEFVPIAGALDIRGIDKLSDEQYKKAGSWCSFTEAKDGRRACITDAVASLFWGGENDPDASFRFCGLLDDEDVQDACWSRLSSDIFSFKSGRQRDILCRRIPEDFQNLCVSHTRYR
jgi:hypothetical protein